MKEIKTESGIAKIINPMIATPEPLSYIIDRTSDTSSYGYHFFSLLYAVAADNCPEVSTFRSSNHTSGQ